MWGVNPAAKAYWDDTTDSIRPLPLRLLAAKGEILSLQIALRSPRPQAEIRVQVGDLIGPGGASVPSPLVRWVECVPVVDYTFTHGDVVPDVERPSPALFPDPLVQRELGYLYAGQTRSVYLTVTVPNGVPAGHYQGTVEVCSGTDQCDLPVVAEVVDYEISSRSHLHMTNWQMEPRFQARIFQYEVGSARFWAYVEAMARDMAAHRSNVFMAYYYDLVRGGRRRDETRRGRDLIEWDFRDFDRYVQTFLDAGAELIEGQHVFVRLSQDRTALGMQARGDLRIGFQGEDAYHRPVPENPARPVLGGELFDRRVGSLLDALYRHLCDKGWKDRFVLHVMDEPGADYAELYREARGWVRTRMPDIPTVDASQTMDLELDFRDRYVPLVHAWNDAFRERQRQGARDWWYVCWGPRSEGYPNRFIDYPLMDVRLLFWLSYKEGVSGFLHWGYNRYFNNLYHIPEPRDPYEDPGVGFTAPGDGHIVYPGEADSIVSSLRWEQTLEGQQDYEHLLRLSELSCEGRGGDGVLSAALEACCPSLTGCPRDPDSLLVHRERVVREIARLLQQ